MKTEKLSKAYGEKTVLTDLSLNIPAGSSVCIMGQSGSGKTTLLRILLGLEKPDSGKLFDIPKRVSVVFQEDRLCENLSAAANIRLVCQRKTVSDRDIIECLAELGMKGEHDRRVHTMSGGMKRRVAIARALLCPGEAIFMDEPLKGLDEQTKERAAECIMNRRQGRTLLCITHDETEIGLFAADSVIRL